MGMKKINLILKKCKSLSMQLGRSSSYSSLRSESNREVQVWGGGDYVDYEQQIIDEKHHHHQYCLETVLVLVGSTKRRYMISSEHLNHPLLNALIDKASSSPLSNNKQSKIRSSSAGDNKNIISVNCEVVLFDHFLWMLENADPNFTSTAESLEELAALYAY